MRKLMMLLTLTAASLISFGANATTANVATYECYLEGEVKGIGVSFIFGGQIIDGDGYIHCTASNGLYQETPVRLTFVSGGVGFDFSIIQSMTVRSNTVQLTGGPEDMIGSFSVGATAGATLITQGIDFDAAVKVTNGSGLGLELALIGKDVIGLGVRLHAMTFIVSEQD